MNTHSKIASEVVCGETSSALKILENWAANASEDEVAAVRSKIYQLFQVSSPYPVFNRTYDPDFEVTDAYKAGMPDLQNGPSSLIRGTRQQIEHVGISNFRMPIRFYAREGDDLTLEASISGTVSLEADRKGINMSRIMRSFYKYAKSTFSFEVIEAALDDYKSDLNSLDARIQMRFSYPLEVNSLRSGLVGYQFYDFALEMIDQQGVRQKFIHLDYVYSSTCPCSLELSEQSRQARAQLATPHSQRSVARISVCLDKVGESIWFEDLIDLCREAVPTETQVMVKREDEQAFAELNAANPIFVEDAARLFCEKLRKNQKIGDFRVVCSHQESLHSHDAVSVLTEGETLKIISIDPYFFKTLHKAG